MTVSQAFPEAVEVIGSGKAAVDGVYTLSEPAARWGFVYRQTGGSELSYSLRYGEEQPEVGGTGYVGWVIGNFPESGVPEVFARCTRSVKVGSSEAAGAPHWEAKDEAGNFAVFTGFKARPLRESAIIISNSRVVWRLESLREKLKLCSPGHGLESDTFTVPHVGEYKLVLYPFGSPTAAPGCVSLALARAGGPHRMIRFFMRIGDSVSGHKIMAGSEFAVDFSRGAISGRLETLEAELNIVL
jgi:hypothetical protein